MGNSLTALARIGARSYPYLRGLLPPCRQLFINCRGSRHARHFDGKRPTRRSGHLNSVAVAPPHVARFWTSGRGLGESASRLGRAPLRPGAGSVAPRCGVGKRASIAMQLPVGRGFPPTCFIKLRADCRDAHLVRPTESCLIGRRINPLTWSRPAGPPSPPGGRGRQFKGFLPSPLWGRGTGGEGVASLGFAELNRDICPCSALVSISLIVSLNAPKTVDTRPGME